MTGTEAISTPEGVEAGLGEAYLRWLARFPLRPIRSHQELDRAIATLDALSDQGSRTADEHDYMMVLALLVGRYEEEHFPMPSEIEDREILRRHHEEWLARDRAAGNTSES